LKNEEETKLEFNTHRFFVLSRPFQLRLTILWQTLVYAFTSKARVDHLVSALGEGIRWASHAAWPLV
jgi:hypothetical protein